MAIDLLKTGHDRIISAHLSSGNLVSKLLGRALVKGAIESLRFHQERGAMQAKLNAAGLGMRNIIRIVEWQQLEKFLPEKFLKTGYPTLKPEMG